MRSTKDETLSIRTSAEIKQLVRQAAEREHRSIASMIEVLVMEHAKKHGLYHDKQSNLQANGSEKDDTSHAKSGRRHGPRST
jgi:hypothetical protein